MYAHKLIRPRIMPDYPLGRLNGVLNLETVPFGSFLCYRLTVFLILNYVFMKKKNLALSGKLKLNRKFIISLSSAQANWIAGGGGDTVVATKPAETVPKPQPKPQPKPTPLPSPQSFDGGLTCTIFGPNA